MIVLSFICACIHIYVYVCLYSCNTPACEVLRFLFTAALCESLSPNSLFSNTLHSVLLQSVPQLDNN